MKTITKILFTYLLLVSNSIYSNEYYFATNTDFNLNSYGSFTTPDDPVLTLFTATKNYVSAMVDFIDNRTALVGSPDTTLVPAATAQAISTVNLRLRELSSVVQRINSGQPMNFRFTLSMNDITSGDGTNRNWECNWTCPWEYITLMTDALNTRSAGSDVQYADLWTTFTNAINAQSLPQARAAAVDILNFL